MSRVAATQNKKNKKNELRKLGSQRSAVAGKMIEFFDAHDRAGSTEGLDDDELRSALLAAHPDKSDMVTKEAIDFVKSVADVSKNNVIDKNEIIAAVQAYTTYIDRKDEINRVLQKYDTNHDGKLDEAEVKVLLKALAGEDLEVTEDDIQLVMNMCDASRNKAIDQDEIRQCLAFWYGQLADKEKAAHEASHSSRSKMCIIL
jgi:Ca2+-binding EF-hand superfamily protein